MTCVRFRDTLLGDASPWLRAARAVHGRSCPACRAAALEARALAGGLANIPRSLVPPDLARALSSQAPPETAAGAPRMARLRRRVVALGTLGAAITVAIAVVLLSGSEDAVLADAIEALGRATSLHLTVTCPSEPGISSEMWIGEGGRWREETTWPGEGGPRTSIIVADGVREWYYSPWRQVVEVTDDVPNAGTDARLALFSAFQMGDGASPGSQPSRTTDSEGRACLIYTVEGTGGAQVIFTVDERARRVVAVDVRRFGDDGGVALWREDGIAYDVAIPDGTFTLTPPPGTRTVEDWWARCGGAELAGTWFFGGRLVVHAIDLVESGDVYVCASLEEFDAPDAAAPPLGRLLDDQGRAYAQVSWVYDQRPTEDACGVRYRLWFTPVQGPPMPEPTAFTVELNPQPSDVSPAHALQEPGVLRFAGLPARAASPDAPVPLLCDLRDAEEYGRLAQTMDEYRQRAVRNYQGP